jgi:hypothetical protein
MAFVLPFFIGVLGADIPLSTGPEGWFQRQGIHQIQVDVPPESVALLRKDARNYVRATVVEGTERLTEVGLRVKGRTGSYRTIDEKASLTLTFDHFIHGQRLFGLRKIHLNNSVEDPSYLHEKLGTEMFAAAGVKVPWICHAIVTLNGRRLGLFVVKEGFAPEFFARAYGRGDGDSFEPEPGPGCDVDGPMKRDPGTTPNHRNELSRLADTVRIADSTERWAGLRGILETESFIKFIAMETLLGHRDGYGQARNNYRLYLDPVSGHFQFIPTGMDHLLGRADATLYPRFSGLVAKAAWETPAGRAAYRGQLGLLFTNVILREPWTNRIATWGNALARDPVLSRAESQALLAETSDLGRRFQERTAYIERALAKPEQMPLQFEHGIANLSGWEPRDPPAAGRMERVQIDGRRALSIVAGPRTSASWRTAALLDPGRYRFEGMVKTKGVVALPDGNFHGARLMISGPIAAPARSILGDKEWTLLQVEFETGEHPSPLELQCSLRAAEGQVWFDSDSLRIVRLPGGQSP